MYDSTTSLHRRKFLRGLGAAISLPALEAFATPGATTAAKAAGRAVTASGAPLRMAYLYIPNGIHVDRWQPKGVGRDFEFGETMKPIAGFKNDLQIISRLKHENGTSGGDGAGDHARANASFLTGARPRKTAGADIKLGISVDQMAANQIGDLTRLSSLELTCAAIRTAGRCDSGYSCAYQYNLSWRSSTTPMTPEADPRLVFERLFGAGTRESRRRNLEMRRIQQKSILDFVMEDAQSLNRKLGRNDQLKMDEYLTGVREIERQIEQAEKFPIPEAPGEAPAGIPANRKEHMRLMYDLMVMAFQTDSTRVASFLQAHDGDNSSYREIGISEGHHSLSHHQDDPEKLAKIAKIDLWYMEQFNYFLTKMKQTKDVDGKSLLDNSMIVYGGGLSNGNRHRHDNLPVIMAGHAGGKLKGGQHLDVVNEAPMTNLFMTMLDEMGIKEDRVGDSTGLLQGLV